MKIRIVYNTHKFIIGKYLGKVIYPFMFFRDSKEQITDRLFRHELQHVYQIRKKGVLCFYISYLWYNIRYGYKNNPYELEAERFEEEPLSNIERALKDGRFDTW